MQKLNPMKNSLQPGKTEFNCFGLFLVEELFFLISAISCALFESKLNLTDPVFTVQLRWIDLFTRSGVLLLLRLVYCTKVTKLDVSGVA